MHLAEDPDQTGGILVSANQFDIPSLLILQRMPFSALLIWNDICVYITVKNKATLKPGDIYGSNNRGKR
jgi:hypothetical protein